jgi:hypothetical protein
MIKLKNLLLEQQSKSDNIEQNDDNVSPAEATGKLIHGGLSSTDPWQYYLHNENSRWYTKKKVATKWLDMEKKLLSRYGESVGAERYALATSRLQSFIDNENKAKENNVVVTDVVVDETKLEQVPVDQTVKINKIFTKDIDVPITDVEFREKWIEVSGKRNPEVTIIGKTPDSKYIHIILAKRGLFQRNKDTWALASDFDITKQEDGTFIGTYNHNSGNRFDIYKPVVKK